MSYTGLWVSVSLGQWVNNCACSGMNYCIYWSWYFLTSSHGWSLIRCTKLRIKDGRLISNVSLNWWGVDQILFNCFGVHGAYLFTRLGFKSGFLKSKTKTVQTEWRLVNSMCACRAYASPVFNLYVLFTGSQHSGSNVRQSKQPVQACIELYRLRRRLLYTRMRVVDVT